MRWVFIAVLFFPSLVVAETACPSSFDEFLSNFETNREFKQKNIIYPLKHSFVDLAADPEPKIVDKPLSKSEVATRKRTIYPSPTDQKSVSLVKDKIQNGSQVNEECSPS
mgnify:CR=1 FL=1